MNISDFCAVCERLASDGIQISEASYQGKSFGSWFIDVPHHGSLRRAVWDGKDGWLVIQSQSSGGNWTDEWIGREAALQTVDQAVSRLRA
jgi:hypothetical protein